MISLSYFFDFSPMQHYSDIVHKDSILVNDYQKNWANAVLHNIVGLIHVLSPNGNILYCSESCIDLTGYQSTELTGRLIMDFIHIDDLDIFIRNFQYAFNSMSRVKTHYRFRCKDSNYILLETTVHPKREHPNHSSPFFYAIAQPYLPRNHGLLNSHMEIKMEDEWYNKRLRETFSSQPTLPGEPLLNTSYYQLTPPFQYYIPASTEPPKRNSISCDESSQSNWELHQYTPPVTSSAEDHIPKTITIHKINDATNKDKWKRRKKSNKGMNEYICNDCGTTSSPEWRKGPNGPKTLCNACGLRWAKKNKKDLKMN